MKRFATAKHSICAMKFPAAPIRSPAAAAIRAILIGTGTSQSENMAMTVTGNVIS